MTSMNRTTVRLILVALLLASAVGAYAWWYAQVATATDRAAALAARIEETWIDSERTRDARAQLAEIAGDEATARAHFVPAEDVVPFLEALEATGVGLGSDVEVVSVAAQTEPRAALNVSLRITGGFDAVLRTLGAIEYAPYDIEMRRLTFDSTGGSATTTRWAAEAALLVGTTATRAATTTTP